VGVRISSALPRSTPATVPERAGCLLGSSFLNISCMLAAHISASPYTPDIPYLFPHTSFSMTKVGYIFNSQSFSSSALPCCPTFRSSACSSCISASLYMMFVYDASKQQTSQSAVRTRKQPNRLSPSPPHQRRQPCSDEGCMERRKNGVNVVHVTHALLILRCHSRPP
jgi:hypothetical protein